MGFNRPGGSDRSRSASSPPRTPKPTILVVEDDETIATFLKFMLEKEGFKIMVIRDGREAADFICRNNPPRLVLMDIMLPYMDGFRLLGLIREEPRWREVPMIMLTSVSEPRSLNRAIEAGANDYMVKPFAAAELVARVRRFVPTAP